MCTVFFWAMLSGHVESSSPKTSFDSGEHQAHSGAFATQNSAEHLLISPFSLFPYRLSVSTDFDCSDPLGMESGEIASEQIMASSQYNPSWSPERSRLSYYENAWTPAEDSNKEWIQVAYQFTALKLHFIVLTRTPTITLCRQHD